MSMEEDQDLQRGPLYAEQSEEHQDQYPDQQPSQEDQQEDEPEQGPANAMELMPDDLQHTLELELQALAKCRTVECELLKQEAEAEKDYRKKRYGQPTAAPAEPYSEEARGRAVDWLKEQQKLLQDQQKALEEKLKTVQDKVKKIKEALDRWNKDSGDLFKMIQALPADRKKAEDEVKQCQAALDEAKERGFKPKIDLADQELKLAQARLDRFKDLDKTLYVAVDQAQEGWRKAREELRQAQAGEPEGEEALQIKINSIKKILEFLTNYQDVMIRQYLVDETANAAKAADRPVGRR